MILVRVRITDTHAKRLWRWVVVSIVPMKKIEKLLYRLAMDTIVVVPVVVVYLMLLVEHLNGLMVVMFLRLKMVLLLLKDYIIFGQPPKQGN